MPSRPTLAVLAAAALALPGCALPRGKMMDKATLWPVDPLVKVFRDAKPPQKPPAGVVVAARNEHESAQFVLRSRRPRLSALVPLV